MPPAAGREDWVGAAERVLEREGHAGLSLPALCREMQLTKGSFYHHFKDLADLAEAVLEAWRTRQSAAIRLGAGVTLRERRRQLEDLAAALDSPLEEALRQWAHVDKQAAAALAEIDARRIALIAALIEETGEADPVEAYDRACIQYAFFIGIKQVLPSADASTRTRIVARLAGLLKG